MNAYINSYAAAAGISMEEYSFLHHAAAGLNENELNNFMAIYNSRRKNPQDILLATLLGFVGFAGIQRFMTGQMVLGLLYFFTGGLFAIGTLVDLLSYKTIANNYNRHLAYECYQIVKMGN